MIEKRVLLTGASGLIGRQTIEPLRDRGFTVVALSRSGEPLPGAEETLAADLLIKEEMEQAVRRAAASHLVHLAWHDQGGDRWNAPANLEWAAATLTLVRTFAEAGGKRVVAVGSCAEYDWSAPSPLQENAPLAPSSLYGAAKAATGALLVAAASALGVSLAWARVFFCYGPGEAEGRLLDDVLTGLEAGHPVDCTDGLQERDFLHTADIGRALALLTASQVEGPVNIASGKAVRVRRVIETAARQMGRPELIRLGARPRPPDDPSRIEADTTRLSNELGFHPKFDLESGVADVITGRLSK